MESAPTTVEAAQDVEKRLRRVAAAPVTGAATNRKQNATKGRLSKVKKLPKHPKARKTPNLLPMARPRSSRKKLSQSLNLKITL